MTRRLRTSIPKEEEEECWNYDENTRGMERYSANETGETYITITRLVVPTQYDKEQLLMAIKYFHDNKTIDSDFKAVNTLIHLYETPDRIEVEAT